MYVQVSQIKPKLPNTRKKQRRELWGLIEEKKTAIFSTKNISFVTPRELSLKTLSSNCVRVDEELTCNVQTARRAQADEPNFELRRGKYFRDFRLFFSLFQWTIECVPPRCELWICWIWWCIQCWSNARERESCVQFLMHLHDSWEADFKDKKRSACVR